MTTALPLLPDTDWDLELGTLLDEADALCRFCSEEPTRELTLEHWGGTPDCRQVSFRLCDAHADELWGKATRRTANGPGTCTKCRAMIWAPTHLILEDRQL